jgi:hypothetical protein
MTATTYGLIRAVQNVGWRLPTVTPSLWSSKALRTTIHLP